MTEGREAIVGGRRRTIYDACVIFGLSYGTNQRMPSHWVNMIRIVTTLCPGSWALTKRNTALASALSFMDRLKIATTSSLLSLLVVNVGLKDTTMRRSNTQRNVPNSPRHKKARKARNYCELILICFFDIEGIVHKQCIPPGQTVNGKCYRNILMRLREYVRREHTVKWGNNSCALQHAKASAHTSLFVRPVYSSRTMTIIPFPSLFTRLYTLRFFLISQKWNWNLSRASLRL